MSKSLQKIRRVDWSESGGERGRAPYTFDNSMGKIVSFGLKNIKNCRKIDSFGLVCFSRVCVCVVLRRVLAIFGPAAQPQLLKPLQLNANLTVKLKIFEVRATNFAHFTRSSSHATALPRRTTRVRVATRPSGQRQMGRTRHYCPEYPRRRMD